MECNDIAGEQWAKRKRERDGLNKNIGIYLQPPSSGCCAATKTERKGKSLWILKKNRTTQK